MPGENESLEESLNKKRTSGCKKRMTSSCLCFFCVGRIIEDEEREGRWWWERREKEIKGKVVCAAGLDCQIRLNHSQTTTKPVREPRSLLFQGTKLVRRVTSESKFWLGLSLSFFLSFFQSIIEAKCYSVVVSSRGHFLANPYYDMSRYLHSCVNKYNNMTAIVVAHTWAKKYKEEKKKEEEKKYHIWNRPGGQTNPDSCRCNFGSGQKCTCHATANAQNATSQLPGCFIVPWPIISPYLLWLTLALGRYLSLASWWMGHIHIQ